MYSKSEYPAILYANPLTQQRYIAFPDKTGTVALTNDDAASLDARKRYQVTKLIHSASQDINGFKATIPYSMGYTGIYLFVTHRYGYSVIRIATGRTGAISIIKAINIEGVLTATYNGNEISVLAETGWDTFFVEVTIPSLYSNEDILNTIYNGLIPILTTS